MKSIVPGTNWRTIEAAGASLQGRTLDVDSQGPASLRSRLESRPRRSRRAVVTLEFILVFPILVIAGIATFQFGILLLVNQAITAATVQGVREAAEYGSTPNTVADVVQQFLAVHDINFDTDNYGSGLGDAVVVVEYGNITLSGHPAKSNTVHQRGNSDIPHTIPMPGPGTNQVRITVCANVTDLAGVHPVPDWLSSFGFSMQGNVFQLRSLANLE